MPEHTPNQGKRAVSPESQRADLAAALGAERKGNFANWAAELKQRLASPIRREHRDEQLEACEAESQASIDKLPCIPAASIDEFLTKVNGKPYFDFQVDLKSGIRVTVEHENEDDRRLLHRKLGLASTKPSGANISLFFVDQGENPTYMKLPTGFDNILVLKSESSGKEFRGFMVVHELHFEDLPNNEVLKWKVTRS